MRSSDRLRTIWHAWRVIRTAWRWQDHPGPMRAVVDDVRTMALHGRVPYGWAALALVADRMGDDRSWWLPRLRRRATTHLRIRANVRRIRRGRAPRW